MKVISLPNSDRPQNSKEIGQTAPICESYETATIIIDENLDSVLNAIIKGYEDLGLTNSSLSPDYLKKLAVISEAITRGLGEIMYFLDNERIESEKRKFGEKTAQKSRFKLIVSNTQN